MSDLTLPDYDDFDFLLSTQKLPCSASELHGILCGAICGGMAKQSREWLMIIRDFCLDGAVVPDDIVTGLIEIYDLTFAQLQDGELSFQLYLPEDDCAMAERAEAITEWLSGFLGALGVQQVNMQAADEEVRDSFNDLVAISQMDTDLDDDDETFASFEEITEYVRMATIMTFSEFGQKPENQAENVKADGVDGSNKHLFH
ncbi:UPF0149 family protein [Catenovulum sp. SM1970]|uniref:UPF0149 family protein n=1 Tax=Marinifaba aquimaris TaxID=2741323 RepID=UPI001573E591|nr:UPF0149 family protein [Marinifaba aquimaris]NTS77177.1 UPF0149 family protein [Marinifaba aquimaris]